MTSSERPLRASGPALWALALLAAALVVVTRVAVDGRASLQAGRAAEAQGQTTEAVRRYLDAGRFSLPGSPWAAEALDRLAALAASAEGRGDLRAARRALEAMRAAILGTRSIYTPHGRRLAAIDAALARLYAAAEDPAVDPAAGLEARVAWHAARLSRRPGTALSFAALALVGLALWLGSVLLFPRRGLDDAGSLRLRPVPAVTLGAIFVVGMALFLAGLRWA